MFVLLRERMEQSAASALAQLSSSLCREDLATLTKVHGHQSITVWAAAVRYDYIIDAAKSPPQWEAVVKRIESMFSNSKARDWWKKNRPDCYASVVLDQTRAYLHLNRPADARRNFSLIASLENIRSNADFYMLFAITEAQLGSDAKVRKVLDACRDKQQQHRWFQQADQLLTHSSEGVSAVARMPIDDFSFPWLPEMQGEVVKLQQQAGARAVHGDGGEPPQPTPPAILAPRPVAPPVLAPGRPSIALGPASRRASLGLSLGGSAFVSSLSPVREGVRAGGGGTVLQEEDGESTVGSTTTRHTQASVANTTSSSSSGGSDASRSSRGGSGQGAGLGLGQMTTTSTTTTATGTVHSSMASTGMGDQSSLLLNSSALAQGHVLQGGGGQAGGRGGGKDLKALVPDYIKSWAPGSRASVTAAGKPPGPSGPLHLAPAAASTGPSSSSTGASAPHVPPPSTAAPTSTSSSSAPFQPYADCTEDGRGPTIVLQPRGGGLVRAALPAAGTATSAAVRAPLAPLPAPAPSAPSALDESSFEAEQASGMDDSRDDEGGPTVQFQPQGGRGGGRPALPHAPLQPQPQLPPLPPALPALQQPQQQQQQESEAGESTPAAAPTPSGGPFDSLASSTEVVRVGGRHYMRLACIGRGGSSRVYRVLGQDMAVYALKRVRLSRMDATSVEPYKNEIALLRRLCAPGPDGRATAGSRHIIRLVDAEVDYGARCIHMVMEAGQADLNAVLVAERERAAALAQAAAAASSSSAGTPASQLCIDENVLRVTWAQMLHAVQAIHEARVVHGDLKPANFVCVDGTLKLIDFGIAKAISDNTTNIVRDSTMGTLNYMCPEAIAVQGSGGGGGMGGGVAAGMGGRLKLGRASDIWSLGCILYQMVYGRTPWADLPLIPKLHAICDKGAPVPYPDCPPGGVPALASSHPDLYAVLQGCLQRDPALRPPITGHGGLLQHPFLHPGGRGAAVGAVVLGQDGLRAVVGASAAAGAALAQASEGAKGHAMEALCSAILGAAGTAAEQGPIATGVLVAALQPVVHNVQAMAQGSAAARPAGPPRPPAALMPPPPAPPTSLPSRQQAEGGNEPAAPRLVPKGPFAGAAMPVLRPVQASQAAVAVGAASSGPSKAVAPAVGAAPIDSEGLAAALAGLKKVQPVVQDKENAPVIGPGQLKARPAPAAGAEAVGGPPLGLGALLRRGLENKFAQAQDVGVDESTLGMTGTWS